MAYVITCELKKSKWKLSAGRKKGLFSVLTVLLFIGASVGIILADKTRYFSTQYALHKMDRTMQSLPTETIKAAMLQLKNNPNDMRYCSPMFFPSLKKNDPNAIATYLAYYALSTKYCDQFWDWGRENCGYLNEFDYGTNALEAKQNIRLCKYAKNSELVQKLNVSDK